MMRPRWQKVLSDLAGNLTRSLLVVASIAVGLFAIGIITTLYVIINQDMRTSYAATNAANLYVQAAPFNEDMLAHIRRVPGVREAEGVRAVSLRVQNAQGDWQAVDLRAYPDVARMAINRPYLVEGTWPARRDEIALDAHRLPQIGARVGDMVRIELSSGKARDFRLTGIVQDLTIGAFAGGGGGFFLASAQGYLSRDALEPLDQAYSDLYNGLYVTVDGDRGDLDAVQAVANRVTHELESSDIAVDNSRTASAFDHPNSSLVDAIVGVLVFLGLLTVFLSGFLVTNTLQALLAQQINQIGIMKSVGGSRMQISTVYMALIFVFGLLALAIAVPGAYIVSYRLHAFLAGTLNFVVQSERLLPEIVALQGALALLMPQLAAWVPIWQGTHISVHEALSGIRQSQGERRRGSRARPAAGTPAANGRRRAAGTRWISRPLLLALRNTFRRKGRVALTLLTLSLGGAVFIATFNVKVSLDEYIAKLAGYFGADANLTLARPYRADNIAEILYGVPGVRYVETWAVARSELLLAGGSAGERVQLLAPPADSPLVQPMVIDGRWIRPDDGNMIILGELFRLRFPELHVGDTLRMRVNGKDTDWVVAGFFQLAGKNGGFIAYANFDYLAELTGQTHRDFVFRVIGPHDHMTPAEQEVFVRAIAARLDERGIQVADLTTGAFLSSISSEGFEVLTAFLLFLSVLTALVGSIGLAGTMSMNVMERTHEIGVLRAVGASDLTLFKMVLVEGLAIGALSYVIGAGLSFPISKILADAITRSVFGAPSSFGFTITGFVIWLVVVFILSFLASVVPARGATRLTIREVLAYE